MRLISPTAIAGSLTVAAALVLTSTATTASADEAVAPEPFIFATTDEDNIPYLSLSVCAEPHGPENYRITLKLITPGDQPLFGNCGTARVLDLPGTQELLDSVELDPDGTHDTARYDNYDPHEVKRGSCVINQWFPGTNILSGNVLNDVVDAPVDVIVQVITLLAESDTIAAKPIQHNIC